jgi:protein-tyrosine phosphatase
VVEALFNHILVVCVGNICRSPMADALLREALVKDGDETRVIQSAGIGALVGEGADENSQTLMSERGIDISGHVARQLGESLVSWADLILVMEQFQQEEIQHRYPTARGKVFLLGHWSETEIADPFKKELEDFRVALAQIEKAVNEWSEKILIE